MIMATNRQDTLDPALLRPGRQKDRVSITFRPFIFRRNFFGRSSCRFTGYSAERSSPSHLLTKICSCSQKISMLSFPSTLRKRGKFVTFFPVRAT